MILTTDDDRCDVLAGIEEEELAHDKGLDQHDRARCDDCQQTDDVEDTDDVQHDVAGAGEGLSEAAHGKE